MENRSKYLDEEPDGLLMRSSNDYARYKLLAVRHYLTMAYTAVRKQPWRGMNYIDLFSGPGKNQIGEEALLGSPLIALSLPHPPNRFFFNEINTELVSALKQRVLASPLRDRVVFFEDDANKVVSEICKEIRQQDSIYMEGVYSSFNVAFLDPEGLELHWDTVLQLAQMKRMDLIILFSTQGIIRSVPRGNESAVDQFFGTTEWRTVYEENPTTVKRSLIDFYRMRLEGFGYKIEIDPDWGGHDIRIKNSKNSEVYSLIFASKNPLGDKLWKEAGDSIQPPKLPGFS